MINFKAFLLEFQSVNSEHKEKILKNIEKHSLKISRKDMPQISEDDINEFLSFLKDNGVTTEKTKRQVNRLRATQKHLNFEKVENLLSAPDSVLKKLVIISNDGRILDGHHRFAALYVKEPTATIEVIEVNTDMRTLLSLAKKFPKTTFKKISEDVE